MSSPPSRTPSPMPTSPTSPLAAFPPLPEPSARSRAPEIYGFVAWTGTALGYVLFLIWALAPPGALDAVGWTWYPSREWAVRVPAWSCILALCTYAGYYALALLNTPSFDAPSTIIDPRAHYPAIIQGGSAEAADPYTLLLAPGALAAPYDIPIGRVNRELYLRPTGSRAEATLPAGPA